MKKLAFVLSFLMVLMITITSCNKKDDVSTPNTPSYNQPTAYIGSWIRDDNSQKIVLASNSIVFSVKNQSGTYDQMTNYSNWEVKNNEFITYKSDGNVIAKLSINQTPNGSTMILNELTWFKQ